LVELGRFLKDLGSSGRIAGKGTGCNSVSVGNFFLPFKILPILTPYH